MHHFPFTNFSLRHILLMAVSLIILTTGLFWQGEPASSWAAPAQNPHLQTIPTRPPDVTPSPTPSPTLTNPSPTAELPVATPVGGDEEGDEEEDENEDEDDNDDAPENPSGGEEESNPEGQPTSSSEQEQEEAEQSEVRATPTPRPTNNQTQAPKRTATPKPGAPINSGSVGGGGNIETAGEEIAPETISSELPDVVQPEAEEINSVEIAPQATASATERFSLLGLLLALIVGVILIMGGVFLVHRS